jgi:apolipoprotein N-acyltransferase
MISDLREATRSISRIAILQRDLYVLNAELKALTHAKRIAYMIGGLIFLQIAFGLGLLWIGVSLYLSGFSAGAVAFLSFAFAAALAAVFFFAAIRLGKNNEGENEASRYRSPHQPPKEARA